MSGRISLLFVIAVVGVFMATGICLAGSADDLAQVRELYAAGDFDTALQQLSGLTNPDSTVAAEALKLTADCYLAKTNTSEALRAFQKLASAYPKSPVLTAAVEDHISGLKCCAKVADEESLTCFRRMAAKYPDNAAMWRFLASDALKTGGKDAEALVELLKAYDCKESKANRIWEARANVRMYAMSFAEFDKVISDAKTVLAGNTDDRLLWECVLGYGYLCKGSYKEAIHELEFACQLLESDQKVVKQGKIWRTAKYALASAHEKNKAYDKAAPLYKEIAQDCPGFWRAQYGLFVCMAKQDELAQASAYINKVCADQPAIKDRLRQLTTSYMLSEAE